MDPSDWFSSPLVPKKYFFPSFFYFPLHAEAGAILKLELATASLGVYIGGMIVSIAAFAANSIESVSSTETS